MATLFSTVLAVLVSTVSGAAIPQTTVTTGGPQPPFPTTVKIDFWQGLDCSARGYNTGYVNVTSSECVPFNTEWISVPRAPHNNCTVKVWFGSDSCSSAAEEITHQIFNGAGSQCVYAGVLEPTHYHASGMWTCG